MAREIDGSQAEDGLGLSHVGESCFLPLKAPRKNMCASVHALSSPTDEMPSSEHAPAGPSVEYPSVELSRQPPTYGALGASRGCLDGRCFDLSVVLVRAHVVRGGR